MDEILIEEKKYVSSKRAAQITGYAKDYIGQLCREGRVPARLVGRSWYVLEAAIQDHRFGKPVEDAPQENIEKERVAREPFPKYEAVEAQILPSVNRLRQSAQVYEEDESAAPTPVFDVPEASESGDPWKNWFDTAPVSTQEAKDPNGEAREEVVEPTTEEPVIEETGEIDIPIRAIHHPEIKKVPERSMDEIRYPEPVREEIAELPHRKQTASFSYQLPVQVLAILLGASALFVAALGSGYLDAFAYNLGPASTLAGVSSIEK